MKTYPGDKDYKKIVTIGYNQQKPVDIIKSRLLLCILVLIIYAFLSLLHIGCPIKFFTGISCPGCGMTRSILSILRLNFKDAFYYHPLFFITPFMFFLFLFECYIHPRLYKLAWALIIILFLVTYLYRLFVTKNDIVNIDIASSIMLQLVH